MKASPAGPFALVLLLALLALTPGLPAHAREWRWFAEPTPASSLELLALHEQLLAPASGMMGIAVEDATWSAEGIEIHLRRGVLYPEPPIQGASVGAYFEGDAVMRFAPEDRKARDDLRDYLGVEELADEPATELYFLAPGAESILDRLGVPGQPAEPLADPRGYERAKAAVRQLGTRVLWSFLNRRGRSREKMQVLMAPTRLRETGYEDAYLLYTLDLASVDEIALSVFGHREMASNVEHRFFFREIVSESRQAGAMKQAADVELYQNRINIVFGKDGTEEETRIHFKAGKGLRAARFSLVPWLEVQEVHGCRGEAAPFVQWQYMSNSPNYDSALVVDLGQELAEGESCVLTVRSVGEIAGTEDDWYPRFSDQRDPSHFELEAEFNKDDVVLAAGELLKDETRKGRRSVHYRTRQPQEAATISIGDLKVKTGSADDIRVEVYAHKNVAELQNQEFVLNEICNAVKIYNRVLVPLDIRDLRVASTYTQHGRGFEGLILLGGYGLDGTFSESDTFRAHEVAHQWWGNMVRPRRMIEDRWLSESLAEYMAMEYYAIRFDNPKKTRHHIFTSWVQPEIFDVAGSYKNLSGEKVRLEKRENFPLADGGNNVYTKGPAVIQMLRYLFQLRTGSDEEFWKMLREFLKKNAYRTVDTDDFQNHAESFLKADLEWFMEQWYFGRNIPQVRWQQRLEKRDQGWMLTVEAQQDTDYNLVIPIYVHFDGGVVIRPLALEGRTGARQLLLPEQPASVSLNDGWEALVAIRD